MADFARNVWRDVRNRGTSSSDDTMSDIQESMGNLGYSHNSPTQTDQQQQSTRSEMASMRLQLHRLQASLEAQQIQAWQ